MLTAELKHLVRDDPTEPDCHYCGEPGGHIPAGDSYLHQSCYLLLGAELADAFDTYTGEVNDASRCDCCYVAP